jgi:hypothetical protein
LDGSPCATTRLAPRGSSTVRRPADQGWRASAWRSSTMFPARDEYQQLKGLNHAANYRL